MSNVTPWKIGAVIAGPAFFIAMEAIGNVIAIHAWPAYAAAFPTRAFTLPMLLARQASGVTLTIVAGCLVSIIARRDQLAVLWAGIAGFSIVALNQLMSAEWLHYPLWYRLLFLSYIVPGSLLGGWLNCRAASALTPTSDSQRRRRVRVWVHGPDR